MGSEQLKQSLWSPDSTSCQYPGYFLSAAPSKPLPGSSSGSLI